MATDRRALLDPETLARLATLKLRARAILDGRLAASVEDVRALAKPVLVHRVITNFRAESENVKAEDVVQRLLERVKP